MDDRMRILLCEDDENLGMLLREYLQAKGFNTDLYADGEAGYKAFLKGKYDICVLDVMMPKKDGFTLAQEIRAVNSEVPIIFLTAKTIKEDILEGFKIGADDYIAKPLMMKEVKARVKAVLRRTASASKNNKEEAEEESNIIRYKGIMLNMDSKTAVVDGDEITLTKLEFELLSLFLRKPNRVFGREDLLERCWPRDVYVQDRTVDVNITRLRKKIGDYGKQIKTRVGYGYYFEN